MAEQALFHAGDTEHAQHQRVRIRQRALRRRSRQERRRERLDERPQPLRGIGRAAVKPGEQKRPRGVGERARRAVERLGCRIGRRIGAARRRERQRGSPGDVGGNVEMDRTAGMAHGKPGGVRDSMRGRLGLDPQCLLASGHGRRVTARDQDHRRAGQRSRGSGGDGLRRLADDHRAGRVDEIGGDRGDDARARLAGHQRDGQSDRARRLEDRKVGVAARQADETRRPGTPQTVDDDVGDGGPRHLAAKPSNTGRMRSSAFLRLASEFAYENRRYPSPWAPNAVPESAATPASVRRRSATSADDRPVPVMFGKT